MQKTDLNVAPYYDDFDVTDNFHRVLFRPGSSSGKRTYNTSVYSTKSSRKTW